MYNMSRAYDFHIYSQLEPDARVQRAAPVKARQRTTVLYGDLPELPQEERERMDDEHLRRMGIDPDTGEWMV